MATTFSLRPHGSGLQHDVHTSGQLACTAEQVTPWLYRSRQVNDTTDRSTHLSRHQQALSTQSGNSCCSVCAYRFNEWRALCVCIFRALGSNERQEHGERGEPHFHRHAEFARRDVTSGRHAIRKHLYCTYFYLTPGCELTPLTVTLLAASARSSSSSARS